MIVKVHFDKNSINSASIESAIDELNGIQNHFYFVKVVNAINEQEDSVSWDEVYLLIHQDQGYHIHIINKPFDDNWFSHEESTCSVITTAGWKEFFAPPSLKAYLIYQIVQSAVSFELDLTELSELRLVHEPPVGCMFDFCEEKHSIKLGMKTGAICAKCRAALSEYGLKEETICDIEMILDYVRKISIGRSSPINPKQVYIVQHYQNHGSLNNALEYSVKPVLEHFNLKPLVGKQNFNGNHYFNRILSDMRASKLVIVLIDCTNQLNNQNTYLEYGLSKGMGKDTLIICERDFIDKLPSDLNGIQVIDYDKDNFPELKNSLIRSLESLFGRTALQKSSE